MKRASGPGRTDTSTRRTQKNNNTGGKCQLRSWNSKTLDTEASNVLSNVWAHWSIGASARAGHPRQRRRVPTPSGRRSPAHVFHSCPRLKSCSTRSHRLNGPARAPGPCLQKCSTPIGLLDDLAMVMRIGCPAGPSSTTVGTICGCSLAQRGVSPPVISLVVAVE